MSNTYNGWTNYATWRVNLEIFDGLEHEEMFDLGLPVEQLRHVLQDYAEETIAMSVSDPNAPNLAYDYAMAFLSDVNWYEIANSMKITYAVEADEPISEETWKSHIKEVQA